MTKEILGLKDICKTLIGNEKGETSEYFRRRAMEITSIQRVLDNKPDVETIEAVRDRLFEFIQTAKEVPNL